MTEWENLKKEYRELPIPTNGPHQVLEAVRRAQKKRKRWQSITRYGTVAAALFVILLLPGMFLLQGGAKSGNNSVSIKEEEGVSENRTMPFYDKKEKSEQSADTNSAPLTDELECGVSADAADSLYAVSEQEKRAFWAEHKESIQQEIIRQMEERMQNGTVTYYVKSEAYPEEFNILSEEQSCYINQEGFLVVVFEAGTVAPEEQGIQEFTIPKEVATP